jgi:multidrug transporter EmrE-like cation transporter
MWVGYLSAVLLGILWLGIGLVMADARNQNLPIAAFYFFGTLTASAIGWVFLGFFGFPSMILLANGPCIGFLTGAALLNCLGQGMTLKNLERDGRSLAYALPQLCFVVPFVVSIVWFGESVTLPKGLGFASLALAVYWIALAGKGGSKGSVFSRRRLLWSGTAALLMGGSQVSLLLALRQPAGISASPLLMSVLVLTASMVFYAAGWAFSPRVRLRPRPRVLLLGGIWGGLAISSFTLLFISLAHMDPRGKGVVFAIGSSIAIAGFALFSVLWMKEKATPRLLGAITLVVMGGIGLRLG